ncbi:hypothetical protein [Chryseobacterium mucoviscidosis]|uniref:Uncharacterized protein n=1 Tax=Chryseobacterium mucoviscidosis TaxID=1945581 RepID=A0A202BY77_9FLAO|nr:hypothetical protein [Chryseobacterium mucoviscidosis]OVE56252.1 hypothetical protein B0E34_11945 [Chryseobacterium mucoviscidosis]
MENEIYDTLYYYSEDGEEGYDLTEVQLIGKTDENRVEKLKLLLQHKNPYISYQAMLILVAWAILEGFVQLDRFISEKWDEKHSFEPHRIYNEDNVYDVIVDALYISTFNGKEEQELYPYVKHFLNIYGDRFFESCLKDFLLKKDCEPLLKEIEEAMKSALRNKKYYQASQLFPVIVHYDKHRFEEYFEIFSSLLNDDKRIRYNIEEAEKIR